MKFSWKRIVLLVVLLPIFVFIAVIVGLNYGIIPKYWHWPREDDTRDLTYEHYCDSIYWSNPDLYMDSLAVTREYQDYIDQHGEWWHE